MVKDTTIPMALAAAGFTARRRRLYTSAQGGPTVEIDEESSPGGLAFEIYDVSGARPSAAELLAAIGACFSSPPLEIRTRPGVYLFDGFAEVAIVGSPWDPVSCFTVFYDVGA